MQCSQTHACWVIFHTFALTFFKINFFKKLFPKHYQSVLIKTNILRADDVLSVLIWVKTVSKGYQPTTKVTASKEIVKSAHGV